MGLYNVVGPCVVGKLHYARSTTLPIEVDDAEAGPLVESGCLEPYPAGRVVVAEPAESTDHEGTAVGDPNQDPLPTGDFAPVDPEPAESPRPRSRRRTEG